MQQFEPESHSLRFSPAQNCANSMPWHVRLDRMYYKWLHRGAAIKVARQHMCYLPTKRGWHRKSFSEALRSVDGSERYVHRMRFDSGFIQVEFFKIHFARYIWHWQESDAEAETEAAIAPESQ